MEAIQNGLFNLDVFKESSEDDLTKAPIGESGNGSEFQSNDPAINPTKDQPSAGADGKVSIPGGEKENPTAKPVDGSNPSIPGGGGEKPSAKAADGTNPSIPGKATLTTSEWGAAMSALKNSFKEGVQILEILENANIVDISLEEQQRLHTEALMQEAVFESFCDGPMFEAVKAEDKGEIKKITKEIKKKLCKFSRNIKWYFSKTPAGRKLGFLDPMVLAACSGDLKLVAWQTIAILYPGKGTTLGSTLSDLNEEFAEALGEKFKLKAIRFNSILGAPSGIKDVDEKEQGEKRKYWSMYVLIVDSKDAETPKSFEVKLEGEAAKTVKAAIEGTKTAALKEGVEFVYEASDKPDAEEEEETPKDSKKDPKKDDKDDGKK